MNKLQIAFLGSLLAAVPLSAAPRLCGNGLPPTLSGDFFSPVECSTAAKVATSLPGAAIPPAKGAKTDWRGLEGRWNGSLTHALGRYEILLTIKTGWGGKADLTLELKELQFRERLTDRLSLIPKKEPGLYEATLTTSLAPDTALKGGAAIGAPAAASTSATEPERQADLTFANGASHRILFALAGKDELRLRAFSAIPGGPLQKFETTLARAKR
jgi:hypothetical protein